MRPPGWNTALVSLLALASVTFLGKSYESSLRGIDSNIHGAVSMSVTSGPGFAPRLPIPMRNFAAAAAVPATSQADATASRIDPNLYFNDHPFFIFWLNGWIMRALGPNAWSARILTALFSVGSVLLTLLIGIRLRSRAYGAVAALLLIFCRDFVLTSATVSLDTALVFFILLSFWFWVRARWIGLGLAAGIGLWVKTPIVLLVFPTALIYELIQPQMRTQAQSHLKSRILPLFGAGALAVVVGSLIWIYTGVHGGWDLVRDYWVRQLWGTAVQGRSLGQGTDWGFFLYYVRTGFLPGLPLLVLALIRVARRRGWRAPTFAIPMIATLILAVVVTGIRFKLGHYVTPAFPFLALLSAEVLTPWIERNEAKLYAGISIFTTLLLATLLVTPISLGPEAFVALKRFTPFIQTHGSCDDRIALVPGGEPVGADLDYRLFLSFYSGRYVDSVACEQLSGRLQAANPPQWVILDHAHYLQCLNPKERASFTATLRMGSQYLLTRQFATNTMVDLTPLELELQAVTDCKAPPYPRDLWHHYVE